MTERKRIRVAILAPHIFMHKDLLPKVIFSPGHLVIDLVSELLRHNIEVTFFSPGYDIDGAKNIHPDMSYFEKELSGRGYGFIELLKKHPLTFISLARQVQAELVSKAYAMGNNRKFDLIHVYMNEEDTALSFANHSQIPVVFTHHDPYNFYPRYNAVFPKYKHLPFISISHSQRKTMPKDTNWVGNVYHGINNPKSKVVSRQLGYNRDGKYVAYLGRIVEAKGVHLAINACRKAGVDLKIAGKHYSGGAKGGYWEEKILPRLDSSEKVQRPKSKNQIKTKDQDRNKRKVSSSKLLTSNSSIEYVGFISSDKEKQEFLGNARALLVPSVFEEPFGMVMIEALACGTPIIGLDSGAIPEVVKDGETGFVVEKRRKFTIHNSQLVQNNIDDQQIDEQSIISDLVNKITEIDQIDRKNCRKDFEERFTVERMGEGYKSIYEFIIHSS